MPYVLLACAIGTDVAATCALKYSVGLTRLWPSVITVAGYVLSFYLFALALKSMSVGTAYAIWSGVGTATIAAIGVLFMGESMTAAKAVGIALVIGGVVLLNLGGVAH
ncbi:multidrug efflux SMR transporter [Streptomyces sp. GESEQ-35]|jgi:small multidrug resistance pump|uniref:DMT family transporter n=1 Tax=Streptomyces sp. GESEQ-35 TaxID=2812657 RepID=UPI001B32613C|nr:multidrug efflux SMR transporter [Streptomyces sp. GESEQ-35]